MKKEDMFRELFGKKPIIGMIHLAGEKHEKVARALKELEIYENEGIDGAIIEDYHGQFEDVFETLKQSQNLGLKITRGINILRDPYSAFSLAQKFGAKFIQFDTVETPHLELELYKFKKHHTPNIVVLGGVGFKYQEPTGNSLEQDLAEAKSRCEAIVTTGAGTGIETPINKLIQYKSILGDFPLVVGAGVNSNNVYEQMKIADGAIVGSYFKGSNTCVPVDKVLVRDLVQIVKEAREYN